MSLTSFGFEPDDLWFAVFKPKKRINVQTKGHKANAKHTFIFVASIVAKLFSGDRGT